ncbi:hypothetical protein DQ392_33535 [Streptomyces reniochalinae]|uniref:Uncharacterized protein n=1 Tax=Streptomyces reniochalinae TaxID=2250578 RepID=A0A367E7P8_9ACTN|nr:hypothetical protein DQ392_33535 [Streptomyces reniochalinae]
MLCRWALGGACAVGWLCAIWRLAVGEGGPVEATVTAGGWGLSVLPVHVAQDGTRQGARGSGGPDRGVTRASRLRRWAAGSGPW